MPLKTIQEHLLEDGHDVADILQVLNLARQLLLCVLHVGLKGLQPPAPR